uniref:Uncharacterized protein n=1 Tax=Knipowitschia caucasica TaxID=637954 RepID=A0AAV2M2V3_KNICA
MRSAETRHRRTTHIFIHMKQKLLTCAERGRPQPPSAAAVSFAVLLELGRRRRDGGDGGDGAQRSPLAAASSRQHCSVTEPHITPLCGSQMKYSSPTFCAVLPVLQTIVHHRQRERAAEPRSRHLRAPHKHGIQASLQSYF